MCNSIVFYIDLLQIWSYFYGVCQSKLWRLVQSSTLVKSHPWVRSISCALLIIIIQIIHRTAFHYQLTPSAILLWDKDSRCYINVSSCCPLKSINFPFSCWIIRSDFLFIYLFACDITCSFRTYTSLSLLSLHIFLYLLKNFHLSLLQITFISLYLLLLLN
jgi:hypothetical protein